MLVAERLKKLERYIRQKGSARVTDLSKYFNVTEETIRRDLTKLETQGKLERSHGGAVSMEVAGKGITFSESRIRHVKEKEAIAREALKFIEEDDTILLDASTTAWQIARNLSDFPLTVLTPSVKVVNELAEKRNIQVISTGGQFFIRYWSFVGPLTERALSGYHVKKLFLSCSGVDIKYGLSDSNENQASLKRHMMEISEQCFLLVDHSKFGKKDLAYIASITDFHDIIIDNRIEKSIVNNLKDAGLSVHLAA